MQDFVATMGIGCNPRLDTLHRGVVGLELAFIDKVAPNGAVWITVLLGVAHPYRFAGRQLDSARALNTIGV